MRLLWLCTLCVLVSTAFGVADLRANLKKGAASVDSQPEPLVALAVSEKLGFDEFGVPQGLIGGYVPDTTPYSTPLDLSKAIPTIPSSPDCSIRPQTVLEIERMREEAARIATQIEQEVIIMNKRKAYVEQMTEYLNDRIRELNKVKSELHSEIRWIELSQNRIQELAEKEKLIKMQDILACLSQDQGQLTGEKNLKQTTIDSLQAKTAALSKNIATIKSNIDKINAGQPLDGSGGSSA